jgi:hypothetical protein
MEEAGDQQTGVLDEDLSLLRSCVCWCDIPEGLNIHHHHCGNFKFHEVYLVLIIFLFKMLNFHSVFSALSSEIGYLLSSKITAIALFEEGSNVDAAS